MTSEKRLEGKVAIITGGASGIGAATAKLFAYQGAKVVISDIQDEAGSRLAEELGPDCRYFHCDVRSEENVSACVSFAVSAFGKLDIMLNNAGVADAGAPEQAFQAITELESEVFDHITNVNIKGTFYGVKHAAAAMIASGKPQGCCILNMCSVVAIVAQGTAHGYTISKHGVLGITKTAASELGRHGIRVNCISPTGMVTPMVTEALRVAHPGLNDEKIGETFVRDSELAGIKLEVEDVANAALFLCSHDAKFISGHNLVLDGGLSAIRAFTSLVK